MDGTKACNSYWYFSFIRLVTNIICSILCISSILLICLPTSDVEMEYPLYFRPVGICILVILFIVHVLVRGLTTKNMLRVYIRFALFLCCFIPACISSLTIEVFFFPLTIITLYFIILPNTPMRLIDMAIAASLLNVYIFYRCFFEMDLWFSVFRGTATNSNQFALVLVGGVISSIYIFIKEKSWLIRLFAILTFSMGVVLVAISSSRTVMITISLILTHSVVYLIAKKKSNIGKKLISLVFIVLVVTLLFLFKDIIYNFIFNKWEDESSGEMTSGRFSIWLEALKDMNLGGDLYSEVNANSEYFNYLILYGLLPFVAYILLCVVGIWKIFMIYKKEKTPDNLFCFYIIGAFMFMSLFENFYSAFGQTINFMFWTVIVRVLYFKKQLQDNSGQLVPVSN